MTVPVRVATVFASALALAALTSSSRAAAQGGAGTPLAPLLNNLGTLHYTVTATDRAQQFFDQGLRLTYGFNHAEAVRSYREASRLDPNCGMCYWGQALAHGPNINDPLPDAERMKSVYDAIQKALSLKPRLTATEQAMIDALAKRYPSEKITTGRAPMPSMRRRWNRWSSDFRTTPK